jgi:hypothetical protein
MKLGFHLGMLKPKSSQQSKQSVHTDSSNKPKKLKQRVPEKLISVIFWDRKAVHMVKFVQQGTTITSEV